MITSLSNDRVKLVRALQAQRQAREREGRFVVEGLRLLEAALAAGARPDFVMHTVAVAEVAPDLPSPPPGEPDETAPERAARDLARDTRATALLAALAAEGVPAFAVSEAVMRTCSDTQTPQGLLAVYPIMPISRVGAEPPAVQAGPGPRPPHAADPREASSVPAAAERVLVVDGVRDPGNLGTLLRTAAGAGVSHVVLAPGTVDAYNPKVVRGGMGAHFVLPIDSLPWPDLAAALAGLPVWLAEATGGVPPWQADLRGPLALIVGGEARGAGAEAEALATRRLTIPLSAGVESFNAATAAAMVLYEMVRQNVEIGRRGPGAGRREEHE